jgi:hypothetical protein
MCPHAADRHQLRRITIVAVWHHEEALCELGDKAALLPEEAVAGERCCCVSVLLAVVNAHPYFSLHELVFAVTLY